MGEWGSDVGVFFGVVSGVTHACRDGLIGGREPSKFVLKQKSPKIQEQKTARPLFCSGQRSCFGFWRKFVTFSVFG